VSLCVLTVASPAIGRGPSGVPRFGLFGSREELLGFQDDRLLLLPGARLHGRRDVHKDQVDAIALGLQERRQDVPGTGGTRRRMLLGLRRRCLGAPPTVSRTWPTDLMSSLRADRLYCLAST
jgi:hypothetical protein